MQHYAHSCFVFLAVSAHSPDPVQLSLSRLHSDRDAKLRVLDSLASSSPPLARGENYTQALEQLEQRSKAMLQEVLQFDASYSNPVGLGNMLSSSLAAGRKEQHANHT